MRGVGLARVSGIRRHGQLALLALLAALTARSLSRGLAPDSLWLDDLWVVVLSEEGTLRQIFTFDAPVSPLFVLLLRVPASLQLGDLGYQLIPFLATVICIPLIGAAAERATGSRAAAVAAAALYASSPILLTFSVRVKQFSLDALVITLLLLLALGDEDDGPALYLVAGLAAPFSFTSIFLSVPLCTVRFFRRRGRTELIRWIIFFSMVALTYATMMAGRANEALHEFWQDFYLFPAPGGTSSVVPRLIDLLTNPFPEGFGFLALLAIPGVWVLIRRRIEVGMGAAAMFLLLVIASMAGRYPVGTGRTEIFTFPVMIILAATGAVAVVRGRQYISTAIGIGFVLLFCWQTLFRGVTYVEAHDREVLELANRHVQEEDGVVVYPLSSWAVAHYGKWPVRLVPTDKVANGFIALPLRERILVLQASMEGRFFTEDPFMIDEQLERFLDGDLSRVWLVATSAEPRPNQWIVESFGRRGYVVERSTSMKGAGLALFVDRDGRAPRAQHQR